MITSITVDRVKLNPGVVTLKGSDLTPVECLNNTITVDSVAIKSDIPDSYLEYLNSLGSDNLPMLVKLSGVAPDANNNIFLLGGTTSAVSATGDGELSVTDVAQTVDYPRIYRSVYEMLRQIRIWQDAHKDSLLFSESEAKTRWDELNNYKYDYMPSVNDYPDWHNGFSEYRDRDELDPYIPKGYNLISDYFAVVALWNYIVSLPDSSINVRLHPADSAGIYIGVNVNVPIVDPDKSTDIQIVTSISFSGQENGNYIPEDVIGSDSSLQGINDTPVPISIWHRVPVARAVPGDSVTVSGGSVVTAGSLSGGVETTDTTDITNTITAKVPAGSRNFYTIQTVIEAIPFFKCTDKKTDIQEKTYSESKKADHFVSIGYNDWTIKVDVYRDGSVIQTLEESKSTPHASVCNNQYSDIEDSESGEEDDI